MKGVDETQLLRFGSGELDASEEAAFLARCEIEPGLWREAALAVAEHRRIVTALGELCANPEPVTVARRRSGSGSRLALAATLAAGLLLGVFGGRWIDGGRKPALPPAVAEGGLARNAVAPAGATWSDLARLVSTKPVFPESEEAALRGQGFVVEEQPPVLYYIDTGDGAGWAVPTQQVTLRYAGK